MDFPRVKLDIPEEERAALDKVKSEFAIMQRNRAGILAGLISKGITHKPTWTHKRRRTR